MRERHVSQSPDFFRVEVRYGTYEEEAPEVYEFSSFNSYSDWVDSEAGAETLRDASRVKVLRGFRMTVTWDLYEFNKQPGEKAILPKPRSDR